MTEPVVAAKAPIKVTLEAGKDYWWCACGQSKNQPFCDGSHKGSGFTPIKYAAEKADGPTGLSGAGAVIIGQLHQPLQRNSAIPLRLNRKCIHFVETDQHLRPRPPLPDRIRSRRVMRHPIYPGAQRTHPIEALKAPPQSQMDLLLRSAVSKSDGGNLRYVPQTGELSQRYLRRLRQAVKLRRHEIRYVVSEAL